MSAYLRQLERLRRFRESRERLDEVMLSQRQAQLNQWNSKLRALAAASHNTRASAAHLLQEGASDQWRLLLDAGRVNEWLGQKIENHRIHSTQAVEAARADLRASRQQKRRAELLEQAARAALLYEIERKEQATADDRFAARLYRNKQGASKRDTGSLL